MPKHSASAAYFLDRYAAVTRRAGESLRDYLGDPSDEHARVLRSSLRRVDASIRLLPKPARGEKRVEEYAKRCRKVLRLTSPVRDADLLAARLDAAPRDQGVGRLARRNAGRRGKLVKESMKASWRLFETAPPRLDRKDLAGIDGRIADALREADEKIAKLLPRVLGSESRVEDLHSLRKRCKRLRFMLEALPEDPARKKAGETLRAWQDVLGAVHDSDVLIECFKREASTAAFRRLLRAERIRRHGQYAKFLRVCGPRTGAEGGRVFFGAGRRTAEPADDHQR